MLVHILDAELPASYSGLLLGIQKLEGWAEARNPPPLKIAVTNGSTAMHSEMPGNLFPSCKLKGHHTFSTQAATVGNGTAEEDPGVELEEEKETEPSADKEVEASGEVNEADQSIEYIVYFVNMVELYQKKNKNWFGSRSQDHLYETAWRMLDPPGRCI